MIINLTQHQATSDQIKVGVVDLPTSDQELLRQLLTFDELPTSNEIRKRAWEITELADAHIPSAPASRQAMIGGALFLMSALERALVARGITPLYAFSRRETVEKTLPDGTVQKTAVFRHGGFVEALR